MSPSPHAIEARIAKRAHAESLGVTAEFISDMVERFYARIQADDMLADFCRAY